MSVVKCGRWCFDDAGNWHSLMAKVQWCVLVEEPHPKFKSVTIMSGSPLDILGAGGYPKVVLESSTGFNLMQCFKQKGGIPVAFIDAGMPLTLLILPGWWASFVCNHNSDKVSVPYLKTWLCAFSWFGCWLSCPDFDFSCDCRGCRNGPDLVSHVGLQKGCMMSPILPCVKLRFVAASINKTIYLHVLPGFRVAAQARSAGWCRNSTSRIDENV